MEKKIIINVGRQFGSGGRIVAQKIGDRLGIKVYDNELISKAAEASGFSRYLFRKSDEKRSLFSFSSFFSSQSFGQAENYVNDNELFRIQSQVIREIAGHESAVIIGRCADYILKDFPDCVNLFLYAPPEVRIRRVCEEYRESDPAQAELYITRKDKERASYYNYFSTNTWGNYKNYDLCIDCQIGVDATVDLIADFMKLKFPQ